MQTIRLLLNGVLPGVILTSSLVLADKAPVSVQVLRDESEAIVVGEIEAIRIEPEESMFEPGFGNSDWGIYLTLHVESVEKGQLPGNTLEVRCFRIRKRRSIGEYATPSGHHPVPGIGTRVRVYLENGNGLWHVMLPNGITAYGDGRRVSGGLVDAGEVTRLGSSPYSFVFPLEFWALLIFIGVPILLLRFIFRRRQRG